MWLLVGALIGCDEPASLSIEGTIPTDLWADIPVILPKAWALDSKGQPMPGHTVSVQVEPPTNARVENGRLIAVHQGPAVVRWSVPGTSITESKSVRINVPDELEILCPNATCSTEVGQRIQLKARVRRDGAVLANAPVMWTSSDPGILLPAEPGLFVGTRVGPAKITAIIGTLSKSITVRVSAGKVDRIDLDCAMDPTVPRGEDGACIVKIGRDRPIKVRLIGSGQTAVGFAHRWRVADPTVVQVVNDKLVGRKIGKTKVTISADGSEASLGVEVWPSACNEKVQAVLTYIIPSETKRYRRRNKRGKKVSLACRVPEPESCIGFYKEQRDLSYPEAFERCCCAAHIR